MVLSMLVCNAAVSQNASRRNVVDNDAPVDPALAAAGDAQAAIQNLKDTTQPNLARQAPANKPPENQASVSISSQCHEATGSLDGMPEITLPAGYQSPDEPIEHFVMRRSRYGGPLRDTQNAVQSAAALKRYTTALENALTVSAREFWAAYDAYGAVPVDTTAEYAYWIYRRHLHNASIQSLVSFAPDSATQSVLGALTVGEFYEPDELRSLNLEAHPDRAQQYLETARDLDFWKYSRCHPVYSDTARGQIERMMLSNSTGQSREASMKMLDEMQLDKFSDAELELLYEQMRHGWKDDTGWGVHDYESARRAIDDMSSGLSPAAQAFLKYVDSQSNGGRLQGTSTWFRDMLNPLVPDQVNGTYINYLSEKIALPLVSYEDVKPASSSQDWYNCTLDRMEQSSRFFWEKIPDLVESSDYRYCLRAPNYSAFRPLQYSQNIDTARLACIPEDVARIALVSCVTNSPVGEPEVYVERVLSVYGK